MTQQILSWLVSGLVVFLMAWMVLFGVVLRQRGVNPNAVAERGSNWMQRLLIAGAGLYDVYLVFRAPFPELDTFVNAYPSPAPWLAIAVMAAGAAIILASQANMGRSWRVGVPAQENHVDNLVTHGMHRFSRNPVYLGIMLFLTGAFLAVPGPLSAVAVIVSFTGLTIIISQEEVYLRARFREQYDDYAMRVRRWI